MSIGDVLTKQDILEQLSRLAGYSFADFMIVRGADEPELSFASAAQSGALAAVRKFTIDRSGKITIELYSVLDILTTILRVRGQFLAPAGIGEGADPDAEDDVGPMDADSLAEFLRGYETRALPTNVEYPDPDPDSTGTDDDDLA